MKTLSNKDQRLIIKNPQTYHIFFDQRTRQQSYMQLLQYDQSKINKEHLNMYGSLPIKKIMQIIEISNSNPNFLPILGVSFGLIQQDFMFLSGILRPFSIISMRQLKQQLISDKSTFFEIRSILQQFLQRSKQLLIQYQHLLMDFQQDCYDFYLIQANQSYKTVIGFQKFVISLDTKHKRSNISQIQEIIAQIPFYNKDQAKKVAFPNKHLLSLKESKLASSKSSSEAYYILDNFLTKYAKNICQFLQQTLNYNITNFILEDHRKKNASFNMQYISMIDQSTGKIHQNEIYHNITCRHFEGISLQTFEKLQYCPICHAQLIFDRQKITDYCQNIFQTLLLSNFMNANKHDVVFYSKQKVFTLKLQDQKYQRDRFSNYFHFRMYIQKCKNISRRSDVILINKYQTIPFHNKLSKGTKYYQIKQLINCPVRGKHCRHWQFYDLRRVFRELLNSQDGYFQCFVCCQYIHFDELIYLNQMSQVIKLLANYVSHKFGQEKPVNICIKLDHAKQQCSLAIRIQQNNITQIKLLIYQTLKNPLMKSRVDAESLLGNFSLLPQSFTKTFYGL